jgi:hypothetical protein
VLAIHSAFSHVLASVVAMAQGEPAGFGYWIGVLVDACGLPLREEVPREKRPVFRKLARFLVENEFEHVSQLRNGQQNSVICLSHYVVILRVCRIRSE